MGVSVNAVDRYKDRERERGTKNKQTKHGKISIGYNKDTQKSNNTK